MKIYIGAAPYPGTVGLSIQARAVEGVRAVPALRPPPETWPALRAMVAARRVGDGGEELKAARRAYMAAIVRVDVAPGAMVDDQGEVVAEGATLICGCGGDARAGACHRVWTAEILERMGWEVWGDWCGPSGDMLP